MWMSITTYDLSMAPHMPVQMMDTRTRMGGSVSQSKL